MKDLAEVALNVAKQRGASYADMRIVRTLNQFINTREKIVQNVTNTESYGFGVRVLVDGAWGFAASSRIDKAEVEKVTERAVSIAKANKPIQSRRIELVPTEKYPDAKYTTPVKQDPFTVSLAEKADYLLKVNAEAMKVKGPGPMFVNSGMFFTKEEKYFASTEGSSIEQTLIRSWPNFVVTSVNPVTGQFEQRSSLGSPIGKGYEVVAEYDLINEAPRAAEEAIKKHTAKSVEPGRKDIVLHPTNLWLTIHESVGHPTELDRVLGFEANYAGTSFATREKLGKFQYGSKFVNIKGDKTQANGLATCGWDDDGVKTIEWDIIKDGVLVSYQTVRDNAGIIGLKRSHGAAYADSWGSVAFQRMPNVSLQPAAGNKSISADDLIADVKDGIYIEGDGSFSIDQQRYNFQFGGQVFYEIKDGKKGGLLRDVAYQSRTPDFWNACDGVGSKEFYRLGGSYFDGKGEPGQINAVSHGCVPARFRQINIINTGRKIK
ncbi:MAG: TldD/PmbA family protein [Acidobacteria bacterium]|nr:TldD/PmbA family protein [Acidobacteriota bacterium]